MAKLKYMNEHKKDIVAHFELKEDALKDINIVYYEEYLGDYSGELFIVFEQDGKLYEVNANHCSCNGFGDQWDPEETTYEAILHRLNDPAHAFTQHYNDNIKNKQ